MPYGDKDIYWSTMAQIMACCLTAPSHYLSQCWVEILAIPVQFHRKWARYAGKNYHLKSNFQRFLCICQGIMSWQMQNTNQTLNFNSSDAETRKFLCNSGKNMVADALAPYVPRSSATMVLTTQDKHVFYEEGLQLPKFRYDGKCK